MNFTEIRDEFFARGTDYLDEDAAGNARADRWLNQAYREILNLHAWPFLQASQTSAPPVSIPDLRRILNVYISSTNVSLQRTTVEELRGQDLDLGLTGDPELYYTDSGIAVYTYPVTTLQVTVRYIKRVSPLSGTDTPLFDEQYHDLIVDRAMMKAYKDSDNFEARAALKEEYDAGVLSMAEDYQIDSREVMYLEPSGTDL